ncbi:type II toxin-antitoxin system RelE/ParE family toxin [Marinobacter sp. HL-58]|uniref:type II toxin-antitoxin system RelE/ParE family toxin n=1 Tax=Marinobacter sp. HL-58 TaxID=1479237 RepID=UPI000480242D|nr:type II toxin-antitoxin system RelE/ParE family toxin [Marinobacter sp. HL-58]KPP99737.1 MAG: Plasmid stabilization system protein [Marinobacter sp. HL-58]
MEYVLSRKAEEDVIRIFLDGVEKFGLAQAGEYHSKLEECFEFLAANPYAAVERKEFRPAVRIHPIGVHLVIYRLETNQKVLIIRVRHSREDWLA